MALSHCRSLACGLLASVILHRAAPDNRWAHAIGAAICDTNVGVDAPNCPLQNKSTVRSESVGNLSRNTGTDGYFFLKNKCFLAAPR